ncbi:hypothetical protein CMI42_02825 [Candidatus Pacearchaeota archaeon]|nr:hypothetical protein [Candidatus Pacearchaeota archaeon]|tara:strand:- start:1688 stop:2167 length:480 start_codon:yes stop_codon:yes gene_type:complete
MLEEKFEDFLDKLELDLVREGWYSESSLSFRGKRERSYENPEFEMALTHSGNLAFSEIRTVLHNSKYFWEFHLGGEIKPTEEIFPHELLRFKQFAIRNSDQSRPYHHQLTFTADSAEDNGLVYERTVMGHINSFKGNEIICYNGTEVYVADFKGLKIKC